MSLLAHLAVVNLVKAEIINAEGNLLLIFKLPGESEESQMGAKTGSILAKLLCHEGIRAIVLQYRTIIHTTYYVDNSYNLGPTLGGQSNKVREVRFGSASNEAALPKYFSPLRLVATVWIVE